MLVLIILLFHFAATQILAAVHKHNGAAHGKQPGLRIPVGNLKQSRKSVVKSEA